jgi:hypothetical protein
VATLLSDDFNRANSTSVVGSPAVGPAPVTQTGTAGISGNAFYASLAPAIVTWDLGTPDVELSVIGSTLTASNSANLVLGYVSATDYWGASLYSDRIALLRSTPGAVVLLAEAFRTNPAGTKLSMNYRDKVLRIYRNDELVLNFDVDTITATKHGLRTNAITPRMDDLLGTDSPPLDADTLGATVSGGGAIATEPFFASAFVYQGHDTKIQDQAAGA